MQFLNYLSEMPIIKYTNMKRLSAKTLIVVAIISVVFSACQQQWDIQNPYENVDWNTHLQLKTNLHTHTTRSDGRMSPQSVVDNYHKLGYGILAITDHNEVTFPWTGFSELSFSTRAQERLASGSLDSSAIIYENRNPKELGMFAIQANEVSAPHHMGSYFNDYREQPGNEDIAIQEIGKKDGVILLNHPGRYTARNPEKYKVDWYVDIFDKYDYVTGMEVYNQGDRYPLDRILWDSVLIRTMPERPVWGYSNDDFHAGLQRMGRNWNVFIVPEVNEENIRKAMLDGTFLYVYATEGHNGPAVPIVESIDVNSKKGAITIQASGQDSIRWISEGKVISRGSTIQLADLPDIQNYVRAEIFGPGSVTGSQPFAINRD
jgi:hypothetical protein